MTTISVEIDEQTEIALRLYSMALHANGEIADVFDMGATAAHVLARTFRADDDDFKDAYIHPDIDWRKR